MTYDDTVLFISIHAVIYVTMSLLYIHCVWTCRYMCMRTEAMCLCECHHMCICMLFCDTYYMDLYHCMCVYYWIYLCPECGYIPVCHCVTCCHVCVPCQFFFSFGCTIQLVGSWFPNQGSNPAPPPQWKLRVLTTREIPIQFVLIAYACGALCVAALMCWRVLCILASVPFSYV